MEGSGWDVEQTNAVMLQFEGDFLQITADVMDVKQKTAKCEPVFLALLLRLSHKTIETVYEAAVI
jgi:hypothetical protein